MNTEKIFHVLIAPVASEKAVRIGDAHNQYVFKVRTDSTKTDIAKAVEQLFKVEVNSVNTLNVAGKSRRTGKSMGVRSDWKKAYVSLKQGFEINFTGAGK